MINMAKKMLGATAAAAALATMAVPAQARDYYSRDRDGISAGEVIAGAVILGGIAAILSSGNNNNRYETYDNRRSNRYGDDRYDRYDGYNRDQGNYYNANGGSRSAINQCVSGVENYSVRYNRSKVTEIQGIDRTRDGYRVSGNVVVREGYRNRGYGRGYDRDDRRYDRYGRGYSTGYDQGRFTCYVERGRVVDIQYRGLDQWR
jgi:hypothetical protein